MYQKECGTNMAGVKNTKYRSCLLYVFIILVIIALYPITF